MFGRKSKIVTKMWEKMCRGGICGRGIEKIPREKWAPVFALVLGRVLHGWAQGL